MVIDLTKGIYRRIYAGCVTGRRINRVSLGAEVLFWRLHCVCDDFGNLEGEHAWIKSMAFPRRDEVKESNIGRWLAELEQVKLIEMYRVGDEHFVHILNFEELQPGGKNGKRFKKFTAPTEPLGDSRCIQVNPGESKIIQVNPVSSVKSGLPHTDTDTEVQVQDHSENDTDTEASPEKHQCARAPISGSDSLRFASRSSIRQSWLVAIEPLWRVPRSSTQYRGDRTSSERLFDEVIWPESVNGDGLARVKKALAIIEKSSGASNRMAYITSRVKRELEQ